MSFKLPNDCDLIVISPFRLISAFRLLVRKLDYFLCKDCFRNSMLHLFHNGISAFTEHRLAFEGEALYIVDDVFTVLFDTDIIASRNGFERFLECSDVVDCTKVVFHRGGKTGVRSGTAAKSALSQGCVAGVAKQALHSFIGVALVCGGLSAQIRCRVGTQLFMCNSDGTCPKGWWSKDAVVADAREEVWGK